MRDLLASFPGQRMEGTLEGYCGLGMHYAMSQKNNEVSFSRYEILAAIEREKFQHQKYAQEAFEIGLSQI
ncbi:hypothetical protein [Paraburkholderia sp. JPY419]|uniref:hypothetical protein n=1 Tax=Paraburkholderia sp. JPY419 TaxID=667660 RepID=UPI003D216381